MKKSGSTQYWPYMCIGSGSRAMAKTDEEYNNGKVFCQQ